MATEPTYNAKELGMRLKNQLTCKVDLESSYNQYLEISNI